MSNMGYAIETPDGIRIKTVSETERAAKINFLVVFCNLAVKNGDTEDYINHAFDGAANRFKARCVRVVVSPLTSQPRGSEAE
jgi:hypothetical protein